jgi:cytochrome c oxidase subunit 2
MDGLMRYLPRRYAALIAGFPARMSVALMTGMLGRGMLGRGALGLIAFLGPVGPALAQKVYAPRPWEMGMQAAGGPLKQQEIELHTLVLIIITLITLFVGALLVYVMWRFNAKRNPTPSQTSHNTFLEVAWTVIPILILVVIAIPSFRMVYYLDRTPDADLTIKVTGHQWYWEYSYPDKGNIDFSSYFVPDDQLKPGQLRLLTVDNDLVIPAGKNIRVLQSSNDVIHSWFIPSLGVQRYAIPGRTIETWFRADQPGLYYGECNQICGTNHSRMPIVVRAVTPREFDAWLVEAKTKFSDAGSPATASATPQPVGTTQGQVTRADATPANVTPANVTPANVTLAGTAAHQPYSLAAVQVQR